MCTGLPSNQCAQKLTMGVIQEVVIADRAGVAESSLRHFTAWESQRNKKDVGSLEYMIELFDLSINL